ncbi:MULTISPECIES: hypothetical protein [Chryseobacterium]|uniref:Uncharacterized protein n=1 Tax=Chryseobacterium taihuense TaxID=1141221 RepID=A0A4U8WEK2_9FLAO|nr:MULTISPECIES: hypothetical protein [Chryseobacterium]QQV02683.1 hypothetical protein I6I61_16715 [Chryseobacterium sp. FDAARGOS 1104]VFB04056.1 Uncharacterised protein [Chryseobacterium taihuense]
MNEQFLIKKVVDYLKDNNISFQENTVEYCGIKKNVMVREKTKDMHFVSFCIPTETNYTQTSFIFIDIISNKIELLLTPQYIREID